jgi:hypothetical protein
MLDSAPIMRRIAAILGLAALALALAAPVALAGRPDGGQGLYGDANDKVVTDAGFILIGAFPLLILILSLIQWRLDKRKEARKQARKARPELLGGW